MTELARLLKEIAAEAQTTAAYYGDFRVRRPGHAGAGGGAAPRVRPGGGAGVGLSGHAAADRPRADDFAAVYRGADDATCWRSNRATRCWRWGRDRAIRPPCWRSSCKRFTPSRSSPRWRRPAASASHGWAWPTWSLHEGDGAAGLEEEAPFDAVIVTAAARRMSRRPGGTTQAGGRMAIPLGEPGGAQELALLKKDRQGQVELRAILPVRFVPLTGQSN